MSSQITARDRATIRASWISLIFSLLIMGGKFFAYEMTRSTAVLSDALESIVNVVAALVALFVMRAVAEPADEEHPYGHGKLEYFSAAFEGGLIAFASLAIANEAFRALAKGPLLRELDTGVLLMLGLTGMNLMLGVYLRRVGSIHKSEALLASGTHVLSDVWTTVAVIIGLIMVKFTGAAWLDPVVALLVAAQLGYSGYRIVRQSAGALIDEMEPASVQELVKAFEASKEAWVIDIHNLKVIRSGHFHHIDSHLVVPEFWDIAKTHEHASSFERRVVEKYPFDGEIAFHIDPCERKYCERCEMLDCPIRARELLGPQHLTVERIIRGPLSDGK